MSTTSPAEPTTEAGWQRPAATPPPAAPWIRLGLVALALPQLATGVWAVLDPSGWFERFPGFGPALVAAEPPYNAHLATDAGAGFLATGVVLALAAAWGGRRETVLALVTYLAFAVPHLTYHVFNPAPGLTSSEHLTATIGPLVAGVALPVLLFWGLARTRSSAAV